MFKVRFRLARVTSFLFISLRFIDIIIIVCLCLMSIA